MPGSGLDGLFLQVVMIWVSGLLTGSLGLWVLIVVGRSARFRYRRHRKRLRAARGGDAPRGGFPNQPQTGRPERGRRGGQHRNRGW